MNKNYLFSALLIGLLSTPNLYANAENGASLFQGNKHFKNGAVACISCHNVKSNMVKSGGRLAIDLTKMGGAGIAYTIKKPENASSPIMRQAYKGKALTASEQSDLSAFFDKVASENTKTSNSTATFVVKGVVGAIILFLLLALLGKKRKKQSVNQKIYDRQLKTSWRN